MFRDQCKIGTLALFRRGRSVVILFFWQSSVVMACSLVFSFSWLLSSFFSLFRFVVRIFDLVTVLSQSQHEQGV